ncbi:hypothetical protein [Streptomyces lavendulae]|uniref:hypothetical protein n=1 Tax=Streptomyces lavendulae TaxID=1914 RepID=UPI00131ED067|nr:hypothetical protein [Streptomyces lavendulae]
MLLPLEPDVAFGWHPDLGVAAAVADARPYLDEVLREHGFSHSAGRDLYLLPSDTPHAAAVRAAAGASRRFQEAHLTVVADPRLAAVQASARPAAVSDGTRERQQAVGVDEVLEQIRNRHGGSATDLGAFINTAAAWCDRMATSSGEDLADDLRSLSAEVNTSVRPASRAAQARAATASSVRRPASAPTAPIAAPRPDSPPVRPNRSR